jgi:hypothetical protein
MGAKRRSEVPEPVADAVPLLLPAPQAPMRAASDRSSANPEAAVPATGVAASPPPTSPEEELERAAKAIRSRATEMATRHGVASADTPPRATPGMTTHADRTGTTKTNNRTQSKGAAIPSQVVAPESNKVARAAGTAPTIVAKPEPVEMVTSAVTDSPATPKKSPDYPGTHQQTRARHARTAKIQRNKRGRHPADTQVLTNAPSGPAPLPLLPTQAVAIPEPFVSDHPSAVFRTAQAAKAEKIVQAAKTNKAAGPNHCPYCSATHPPETERCGCGYLFEASFDLPELVLNAKERAELIAGTYQIKRPKPPG